MYAEPNRAVFLSYASQDAEIVRRICEALRATGIEVWFDQNELVGGDAWDQKIRGQIKACALFVPVISANTNARREGYFRREWKIAVDRTNDMDEALPFLVPVVIDDTTDAGAFVPEKFREVQWSRLPAGETSEAFCARVRQLLGGSAMEPKSSHPGEFGPRDKLRDAASTSKTKIIRRVISITLAIAAGVIVALALWHPWRFAQPPAALTPAAAPTAAPPSEARRLARQAQDILFKTELGLSEFDAAAVLCERAASLDSSDPEVWAIASEAETWRFYYGGDYSSERRESARAKATRALNLAPNSFEARRAQACYLVCVVGPAVTRDAEPMLRELRRERPKDRQVLLLLGLLLRYSNRLDEAVTCFEELGALPREAARAYSEIGWSFIGSGTYDACNAAIDRSVAAQPFTGNVALKVYLAQSWLGNPDLGLATLQKLPASMWLEDRALATAIRVFRWRHEPQQILGLLGTVARDWISWNIDGPKAAIAGDAHEMLNHPAAARNDWKKALELVSQRLSTNPNDWRLNLWKAYLLSALGERAAADNALRLACELSGNGAPVMRWISGQPGMLMAYNLVPRLVAPEELVTQLERRAREPSEGLALADLRLNPSLDEARKLPRFQALLARLATDPRCFPKLPPGQTPTANAPSR